MAIEESKNIQTKNTEKAECCKQVTEVELMIERNKREEKRNNVIIQDLDLKDRRGKRKQV